MGQQLPVAVTALPSNSETTLLPSKWRPAGNGVAVASQIVGSTSTPLTGVSLVVPGLIRPGQRTIPGTRMPPS